MATFSMDMPPALSGESQDAMQLRAYLARLVDRLLYTLNHLDDENLVEGGVGISKLAGGGASVAQAVVKELGSASMGTSTVQHLNAQVAEIVTAVIQHAVIDWANIRHLTAESAIVADFVGEKMFIDKLAVTSAQMVDLTVGQLTVKAKDGNYYRLEVDLSTGLVTARQVTVTAEEIAAGATSSGSHIVETDMTVADLSASSLKAVEALIQKLTAARIDADELFAKQAIIDKLTTGEIAMAIGAGIDLESNQTIRSIKATQGGIQTSVQRLEDGIGTHFFIEADKVRITQDNSKHCEMQLTNKELRFVDGNSVVASYGMEGSRAEKMRCYSSMSVGTDEAGWLEQLARADGVSMRWRNGSETLLPAIIAQEPEDQVLTLDSGSHPMTGETPWDEVVTFTVAAQNATARQWQRKRGGTWENLTGKTDAECSIILDADGIGCRYRCRVTGQDGVHRYTRDAGIRVTDGPVVLVQPTSSVAMPPCSGSGITRAWQYRTGNQATGAWTETPPGAGTRHIRLAVTDSAGRMGVSDEFTEVST